MGGAGRSVAHLRPRAVFVEGADEALGAAVALRLADEGGARREDIRHEATPTGKLRGRAGSIDFASKRRRTDARVLQLNDLTPSAKRVYAYLS